MCRMFAYSGTSKNELERLYAALKKAAAHDGIAERLNAGFSEHGDGWGYAIADESNSLHHYRSSMPIYKDEHVLPKLNGSFSAIFHARKATDPSTIRAAFSHPFLESNANELLFFAHNGYINREALMEEVGFGGMTTDSEMAAKLFAREGQGCIKILEKNTESALNLLIMSVDRRTGKAEIRYNNYYVKKDMAKFYELYSVDLPEGRAVYSSTLSELGFDGRKVEESRLVKL